MYEKLVNGERLSLRGHAGAPAMPKLNRVSTEHRERSMAHVEELARLAAAVGDLLERISRQRCRIEDDFSSRRSSRTWKRSRRPFIRTGWARSFASDGADGARARRDPKLIANSGTCRTP